MRDLIATFLVKETYDLTFLLLLGHLEVCFLNKNTLQLPGKLSKTVVEVKMLIYEPEKYTTKLSQRNKSDILQSAMAPSVYIALSSRKI